MTYITAKVVFGLVKMLWLKVVGTWGAFGCSAADTPAILFCRGCEKYEAIEDIIQSLTSTMTLPAQGKRA